MASLLKKTALKWANEPLEAWDPVTESWIPNALLGRIDLMDRFLSNFNKPTRRRMLFSAHDAVFPESLTIRHPGTKDVYILGTPRVDARKGVPYVKMTILQLTTDVPGGAAGLGIYTRRVPVGPPDDPGWLVDTVYAKGFTDLEFRSSSDEKDTEDLKIENFLLYTPLNLGLRAWDYLELKGHRYRLVDAFVDSGFTSGRIDEEPDTRINFYMDVEGASVYDRLTKTWIKQPRRYEVTGVMVRHEDFAIWSSEAEPYIDVYFEEKHIGFTPVPNTMSLVYQGRSRVVRQVSTQAGTRQWILRCN